MAQPKIHADDRMRWRMLAYLSIALVFAWSTWFSATAVIPQLRDIWALSPSAAAWLTIAVQLGFVVGAVISSLFNIADIVPSRYVIMAGAIGAAAANSLLLVADGVELGIPLRFATGFFLAGVHPPSFLPRLRSPHATWRLHPTGSSTRSTMKDTSGPWKQFLSRSAGLGLRLSGIDILGYPKMD
jgi:hypothetical protein